MTSNRTALRSPTAVFWAAIETTMVVCFIGMLAVMFVQVVARYAVGAGVPWTDETSRYLFIGEIFLGAAIAQRYGEQIRITVLLDVLPDKLRRAMEIFSNLCVIAIAGGLVFGAYGMVQRTSNVMASTLPIPFAVLYAVQGLGIVLLVLLVLRDVVEAILGWNTVERFEGGPDQ